jgi:alkanesulfonate monooxygenase SsuD/methylene tetrahydromethanopterin reductase-like flavin-dependent oxidoreductase (luciferase family)
MASGGVLTMNIGLGMPIGDLDALVAWAQRADDGPFRTLALLDRLVFDNPEPLITLAAVAGATSRIRVQTEVLLAPLREPALLAKQTATLDRVSGGRFTLGIGVGGRDDDFVAAGIDFHRRGRRLDEQMAVLRRVWAGEPLVEGAAPIGPAPARAGGPEVLFGAFAPAAIARIARWGDGLLSATPLEYTDQLFRSVERSWEAAGRAGRPRLVAQANVAVGPQPVVDEALKEIRRYYGITPTYLDMVVNGLLTTAADVRSTVRAFGDLGADEVMLYCWSTDPGQIDRLADVAG